MRTVHAFMHHKGAGFNSRAFAGLEYHRTDGQFAEVSTPPELRYMVLP
jgi:hypothetical protein